jgi:transitional endoplasmic reticulum ATPase
VFEETKRLGPCVVILEDVDLYVGSQQNGTGGGALADLLAVMDGTEAYDDVLTPASTNDPKALEAAATRSARFDTILTLDYPDQYAVSQILARLPGSGRRAGQLRRRHRPGRGPAVRGAGHRRADLREIVRCTVLSDRADVSTENMLSVISEGRWKAEPLTGQYL